MPRPECTPICVFPYPLLVRTFSEGTGVWNLGRGSGLDSHA